MLARSPKLAVAKSERRSTVSDNDLLVATLPESEADILIGVITQLFFVDLFTDLRYQIDLIPISILKISVLLRTTND